MSTLTIIFSRGIRLTITPQRWFAAALCALVALLMWGFVAVVQQGIERGNRMRAEQMRAATQAPATKAAPRATTMKAAKAEQS